MAHHRTVVYQLEDYEKFGGFEHMPKGDLFKFGVNPYNGKVVLTFQDMQENASEIIESVLTQLLKDLRIMRMNGEKAEINDFADYVEGKREEELKAVVVSVNRQIDEMVKARKAS